MSTFLKIVSFMTDAPSRRVKAGFIIFEISGVYVRLYFVVMFRDKG